MTNYAPPVIPEIAKAYQNDPRTQLAIQAIKDGTSTGAVARGKYGYADGIARALQAGIGAYANKQQMAQYSADQSKLLAQRQARGVDGLSGAGGIPGTAPAGVMGATPPPPPMAPGTAVGAPPASGAGSAGFQPLPGAGGSLPSSIASALGSPPPSSAPPAAPPPPAPSGGPPPQITTQVGDGSGKSPMSVDPSTGLVSAGAPNPASAAPGTGGGSQSNVPFGNGSSGAAVPAANPAPLKAGQQGHVIVPDVPGAFVAPEAPKSLGPTRSKLLDAAYRVMADANPYESAQGQDMYQSGMSDQTKLDEAATERAQKIQDIQYNAAMQSAMEDRAAGWRAHDAAVGQNYAIDNANTERTFQSGEKSKDRANALAVERERAASEMAVERLRAKGQLDVANLYMQNGGKDGTNPTPDERAALVEMTNKGLLDPTAPLRGSTARTVAQAYMKNPNLNAIQAHAIATGQTAEARTAGSRAGATDVATSEVPGLATEALAAHKAVPTTGFVPYNRAVQQWMQGTSSPELARAVVANQALINAYGRSFGTGGLSVSARKEAEAKLQAAWGTPAYESAVNQIMRSVNLERAGAHAAISGVAGGTPAPASAPSAGWGAMTVR